MIEIGEGAYVPSEIREEEMTIQKSVVNMNHFFSPFLSVEARTT